MLKQRILKTEINILRWDGLLEELIRLAKEKASVYVCFANVHMAVEAYYDSGYCNIVNEAAIVVPDGKPLSIAMKFLYGCRQDHIPGPDLTRAVLVAAEEEGLSIFLYGSTEQVLKTLKIRFREQYPSLKLAGMLSPPFRPLTPEEDAQITEEICAACPDIVLVGLGCPKQEIWMHGHKGKISALMLGVGAAFPFLSGDLKRAPRWMRNLCLEWLFRLMMEPRRLFKRYMFTNSIFLWLITKQLFKKIAKEKTL